MVLWYLLEELAAEELPSASTPGNLDTLYVVQSDPAQPQWCDFSQMLQRWFWGFLFKSRRAHAKETHPLWVQAHRRGLQDGPTGRLPPVLHGPWWRLGTSVGLSAELES